MKPNSEMLKNMLERFKDKSQRFTRVEIETEGLRQHVQELEKKNVVDNSVEGGKLETLKLELAHMEKEAQLHAEFRRLMRNHLHHLEKLDISSSDVPDGMYDCFKENRNFIDAVEEERYRTYTRKLNFVMKGWPGAEWQYRKRMILWLGAHGLRRYLKEKPTGYIGRLVMGWGMSLAKSAKRK